MKRISCPDSDVSRIMYHELRGVVLLAALAFAGFAACEKSPDHTPEAKKTVVADRPGVLHLTSEELARTVIEVTPVARRPVAWCLGSFPPQFNPTKMNLLR